MVDYSTIDPNDPNLFDNIGSAPASPAPSAPETDLFANAGAAPGSPVAASVATQAPNSPPPAQGLPSASPESPSGPSDWTPGTINPADLANPASPLDTFGAVAAGAAKGIFAAKDFFASGAGLFGQASPPEAQRSDLRKAVDEYSANQSAKWGTGYTLAEGVGQVAVGLLGASTGLGAIGEVGTVAKTAGETLGAVATFEPHAQNFANLVQQVPGLNGPLTQFFASSPSDSDAVGYAKNALTSLGLSSAIVGTFMGSAAMLKALRGGDGAAISSASDDLRAALADHVASLQQQRTSEAVTATQGEQPSWTQQSSSASSSEAPYSPSVVSNGSSSTPGQLSPSSSTPSPALAQEEPSPASASASSTQQRSPREQRISNDQQLESAGQMTPTSSAPSALPTSDRGFHLDEERFTALLNSAHADQEALMQSGGSWDGAVANGHTFAAYDDQHIPWQLIGTGTARGGDEIDAFMARVADTYRSELDAAKGGDVISDQANADAVQGRVALWNQDQSALLGQLRLAGAQAGDLRANMQAGFSVSQKMMQDAWTLSQRIKLGDYSDFGGDRTLALTALKRQWAFAMQAYGSANSIMANSARALRGVQGAFHLTPETISHLNALDPEALMATLSETGGSPADLIKVATPGTIARLFEGSQLLLVNGLLSNPLTHVIIGGSNLFQATARPAMRMAGSLLNGTTSTVGREAASSYGYLSAAIPQALSAARQAWRVGDSIISPHFMPGGGGSALPPSAIGQAIAQASFGPWNNVSDILRNTLLALQKTGTFPSRAVGFQDEFVKQVVYRSQVQAKAMTEGVAQGLGGPDLAQFVKSRLDESLDEYGRATDLAALREAKIATYQNDLNTTGNFGFKPLGTMAQDALQQAPIARVVVPFVRTPVNLFRQGVQLTPGLNLLQQEYRQMINGSMGATAQAQALGQMGLGALLMGSAGLLAYQGHITGDAPLDGKLRSEAMQDGWKPNSWVIPNADGSRTYVPLDRLDPVIMPFRMAANIVSVLMSPDEANQNKAQPMLAALALSLYANLKDKLFLDNISQAIDTFSDPQGNGASRWAGRMAGNYVPYSSLLHNIVTPSVGIPGTAIGPDPIMREADSFISAALSKLPGFSTEFSPRRDWAGDPITVHKGLWSNIPGSAANDEMNRLALQQGGSIGAPASRASGGVDLRGITVAGDRDPESKGRDAYDRYQELAGRPSPRAQSLRDAITKLIGDPRYQALPDGAADTPGTKLSILMDTVHAYRSAAMKQISADSAVRAAETEEMRRVAVARGQIAAPNPTPTNTMDGMLKSLGQRFGLSLRTPSPTAPAPSPVQPATPSPHTAPQQGPPENDFFASIGATPRGPQQ